ncbi:hypothetical protein CBR_g29855 [Chara braunii]|uniref:Transmembrane protein n=1 Tax=Chara braunii TaxID=69332 RepID=A0A388JWU3_CHABU|nr:hypothetical protein CBR_g29855 [Chara braunii]|eukprot:GBG62248.1 hypothetical protein CBR_g29855 [Chara braunii]
MELPGSGTATEGEAGRGRDLRTYSLTSLQIGDMTSYHSTLFIYVSHILQKLIFFVDNSPWTDDGPRSKSVEVWQYLLMQSRRSPFVNWKLERARRHRIKEEEKALLKELEDSAGWECQRQMSQAKLKAMGRKIVAYVKARKKRASHGLYGCVVFEVDWDDFRGINYVNELQAPVFFAIEARTVQKREFDDLGEAYEYYMAKEGPEEEDEEGDEDEDGEDDDGYDEKEDDPDGDNCSHDGDDENVLYDEDEVEEEEEEEEEDRRDERTWEDEQDEEEVAMHHEEERLWGRCEDRQGRWACEQRRGDARAQLSGVSDCSISGQRARSSDGRGVGGLPRVCNAGDMSVVSTPCSVGWPLRLSSHVDDAGHSGAIGISEVRDCRSQDRRAIADRVGAREGVLASNSCIGGSEGFTGRGKFLSVTSRQSQCIVGKSHLETGGNQRAPSDIGWYSEARQGMDSSSRRESGSGWERDDEGDFDDERDCIESDPELFLTPPSSPRGWMQSEASERNDAWGCYTLRRRRRSRECRSPVSDGCVLGNGRSAQQWFPPGVREKTGQREARDRTMEPEFSFEYRKGGKTVDMSLCPSRSVGGVGGLSVQNHDPRSYCSMRTRGCNDRYGGLPGLRGQDEVKYPAGCSPDEETESDQVGNEQSTDDGDECDGPDQSGEEDEEASDGSAKDKKSGSSATASLSASRECSGCLSGSVSDSLVSVSSTASSDAHTHLPTEIPQSCFVESGTVTGDVADVYKDMLIAVRFEDPLLPVELQQMITHDQKRLKMLESGLPSWAIFCQSYPLTRNLYRPWMRALSVYIFFLISLTTVLIGFYDLYKNVPVLKEALHRVFGPLVEWVDAWEVGSRLKYLGTMLFLQNCQKAFRWIMTLSRGLMEVTEFLLKPLERPIWLLSEIMLLPVWNMLVEFCLDVFGLGWSTICAVKTVLEWILMGFFVPLFDAVRLLWYCVEALVYPLFAAVWAVISLPFTLVSCLVDILVALSVGIFEGVRLIFSMIGTLSRMAMSFRRISAGLSEAKVVATASPSTWRSLYQEIFSKVFYAIRGIVNGILTFALACNRHRVSIYNYVVMKWQSLEECMVMTVNPKPLKQETGLMKRAADPPSRIQQAALRQAEHIRSQSPQLRMALQVAPRTGSKPDSGRRVNCPSFVSPEVMRPLSGEGHSFGTSGGNGSGGASSARRSLVSANRAALIEQSRGSLSDCSPVRSRANSVVMTKARLRRTRGGSDGVEQKVLDTVAFDDHRRLAPSGFVIPERVGRSEQPTQPPWALGIPQPVPSSPRSLYSDAVPEQPSIPGDTASPCSSRSRSPSFSSVSFSSHFASPNETSSSSSTGSTPERRRPSIPALRLSVPHVVSRSAPSVPQSFSRSQPTFSSELVPEHCLPAFVLATEGDDAKGQGVISVEEAAAGCSMGDSGGVPKLLGKFLQKSVFNGEVPGRYHIILCMSSVDMVRMFTSSSARIQVGYEEKGVLAVAK